MFASAGDTWHRVVPDFLRSTIGSPVSNSNQVQRDISSWFSLVGGPNTKEITVCNSLADLLRQVTTQSVPSASPTPPPPNPSNENSKPQSSTQPPQSSTPGEMAYVCADPAPFAPEGFNVLAIQHRERKAHAVIARPSPRNEDVAIVTSDGMPDHEYHSTPSEKYLWSSLMSISMCQFEIFNRVT